MGNPPAAPAENLLGPGAGVAWHPDGTTICVTGGAGAYLLNYQPRVKGYR
jgi:hypothetical protein